MGEQSNRQGAAKDLASGALLASAPTWILTYVLMAYGFRGTPIQTAVLLNLSAMGCSALAASLVARKTGLEARRIGLTLGLLAYIMYAIFLTIVGFRGDLIEETSPLTGFFVGSALGSKLVENRQKLKPDPP
jgi:hypothetical protein